MWPRTCRGSRWPSSVVLYVVPASLVGVAVASATLYALPSGGYPEARLLAAAAAFLLAVTATAALTDRFGWLAAHRHVVSSEGTEDRS